MAFAWSAYQQAVFDFVETTRRNLIVQAVAGAGKTTTLLECARRMEGQIYIAAFNKKIAVEMEEKLATANLPNVKTGTFHAAGFSAVRFFNGKGAKTDVDDKKVRKLVDDLVLKRPDLEPLAAFIQRSVGMAKNVAIGVGNDINDHDVWLDMTYTYGLDEHLPDEIEQERMDKAVAAAIYTLKQSNAQTKVIDYADMIYLPLVHGMRVWQYDVVMIDEAQDTNRSRLLLSQKMVKRGGRVVAVGDRFQAIYGFTGAMHNALDEIRRVYNCEELPLSVTYRSAKSIVAYAQGIVPHILAAEGAAEGTIRSIGKDAFDGTKLTKADAILCRNNAPLVATAFGLIRRGIPCKIEGREIGQGLIALASKWRVKNLDKLRDRLETYRDREIAKAVEKQQEQRADAINDKVDTLLVLVERAEVQGLDIAGLKAMITEMFSDDVQKSGLLTLCSYHKSKGLEWNRVFRLDHAKFCPSKYARQEWQIQQERNLDYVSATRAKLELVEVDTSMEEELALAA